MSGGVGEVTRVAQMDVVRTWLDMAISAADYTWFDADDVLDEPIAGPRPEGNYLSLQMLVFMRREGSTGDPGHTHDYPNDTAVSILRVYSYGEDAMSALASATLYAHSEDVQLAVNDLGYVLVLETPDVQELAQFLETDTEVRGYLDVMVGCLRVGERVIEEVDDLIVSPPTVPQDDATEISLTFPFGS